MIRLEPTSRHPIVLFFLVLLLTSSFTIGLGAPAPGSVEEALPHWGVITWAAVLGLGSLSIMIGLWMQPRPYHNLTGALLEQVGMAMLGAGGILYSIAAIAAVQWSGVIPAGLVAGLAAACVYRYLSIRKQAKAFDESRKAQGATDDGER